MKSFVEILNEEVITKKKLTASEISAFKKDGKTDDEMYDVIKAKYPDMEEADIKSNIKAAMKEPDDMENDE